MERGWRRATWVAATLFVAALLWGGWQWQRRGEAEALQLAQQQRALYELTAQVEEAQVLLAKGNVAASDEQRSAHLTDAWRQAFGAQSNLNQLPLGPDALMRTSQLLAQAGDYAYVLARQAARGERWVEEQRETLAELQEQLGIVAERLHEVIARAAEGGRLSWRELRDLANTRLRDGPNGFRDGFAEIGRQLVDFPTLIYDGPFSDHVIGRTPLALTGEDVDKNEAQNIARRFAGVGDEQATVNTSGEATGIIPAWQTRIVSGDGVIDIDVAQQGGHVVWMLDGRTIGAPQVSEEDALQSAIRFLAERGHEDVVPTWVTQTRDRVVIPFVHVDEDVVVYPDMIKVTVALDDGGIIGYDAFGYLMAHHDRDVAEPVVSEAEARELVHEDLQSDAAGRLALIPRDTHDEVLTWEFPAQAEGDEYIVYINALTGEEERILKLLDTEEGWLVL